MVWGLSNPFRDKASSGPSAATPISQNDASFPSSTPGPSPGSPEQRHSAQSASTSSSEHLSPEFSNPWHDFVTDPSDPYPRLNMSFPARLSVFSLLSFSTGFLLGSAVGGPEAALRYRALNAHRLPTSTPGWYFYHKSKNYHAIVGGVKSGLTAGFRTTAWGLLFFVVEEIFDKAKGWKDFTSSSGAGLTMAGIWSLRQSWINQRMGLVTDVFTTARTARLALIVGTGFGLAQDGLMWVRGDEPPYVRWVRRKMGKGDGAGDGGGDATQGEPERKKRLLEEGDAV